MARAPGAGVPSFRHLLTLRRRQQCDPQSQKAVNQLQEVLFVLLRLVCARQSLPVCPYLTLPLCHCAVFVPLEPRGVSVSGTEYTASRTRRFNRVRRRISTEHCL